jgi:hypothetical protein
LKEVGEAVGDSRVQENLQLWSKNVPKRTQGPFRSAGSTRFIQILPSTYKGMGKTVRDSRVQKNLRVLTEKV